MIQLGRKNELTAAGLQLTHVGMWEISDPPDWRRPVRMPPSLGENERLLCSYDQWGMGFEILILCENVEDMQQLWDKYARGAAMGVDWFKTDNKEVTMLN